VYVLTLIYLIKQVLQQKNRCIESVILAFVVAFNSGMHETVSFLEKLLSLCDWKSDARLWM